MRDWAAALPFHNIKAEFPLTVMLGLLYALFLSCYLACSLLSRRTPLPPGPKGKLFVGVTFELLSSNTKPSTLIERWGTLYKNTAGLLRISTIGRTDIILK